ncbi:hypothetical protein MJO28_004590 [Puccinia striiformis f. sp. tritici]|uniref:Uncharacterized protein n=3 Tax=Puccinia striiformis TaxID=27350 RepID=A0A0L0V7I6_9BASI|nr:hypothetical protein Pst134EB_007966 [Puccinia striiformis f. sp. tritici]KAI7957495.1 hypothetical protein MJO28_004590 [Puccinia striiformis f. sp. tritici]KNE95275.1 hypothetical protein PSTG_11360 [Puccinia striiformis f. sp. tritici PST-78]POW04483.1 hypothetical protein PSHT_11217 [Puccinia striiformis]
MADIQPSSLSGLSQPEFIRQETPKVVIGGVCTGIAGMTIGSLLAVQKNQPATLPALSMCLKTTSFGTAFFALRQFIVNPILHINQFPSTSSTSNRHFHGLLPTGISAAIIGGSVNGYLRGRHVVGRSSMTTSLVCCTLQVIYNEIGILSRALSDRELQKTVETSQEERGLNPAWWESYIPLSKISDKEWKERILVQLSQSDLQLKTLNRQINQLQECISTRHLNKPQSSN